MGWLAQLFSSQTKDKAFIIILIIDNTYLKLGSIPEHSPSPP
jgi:hypothetical protein